jgi:hypothetical protein
MRKIVSTNRTQLRPLLFMKASLVFIIRGMNSNRVLVVVLAISTSICCTSVAATHLTVSTRATVIISFLAPVVWMVWRCVHPVRVGDQSWSQSFFQLEFLSWPLPWPFIVPVHFHLAR